MGVDRKIVDFLNQYYQDLEEGRFQDDEEALVYITYLSLPSDSLVVHSSNIEYREMGIAIDEWLSICGVDLYLWVSTHNDPLEARMPHRITESGCTRVSQDKIRVKA